MTRVTITATLATTRRVDKYGGVRLPLEMLEGMRDQFSTGHVPMQMNHTVLARIDATVLDARIEQIADEEHALLVDFEADQEDWDAVEAEWSAAGVQGGFSPSLTQLQEKVEGPSLPPIALITDAGAYSDEERAEAARLIAEAGSVEVLRLFQFSAPEFAKIVLEFAREVGAGTLIAAICYLVGRHQGPSHIELKRTEPDGTSITAVLDTDDPEIVRAAAQSLDAESGESVPEILIYDIDSSSWKAP